MYIFYKRLRIYSLILVSNVNLTMSLKLISRRSSRDSKSVDQEVFKINNKSLDEVAYLSRSEIFVLRTFDCLIDYLHLIEEDEHRNEFRLQKRRLRNLSDPSNLPDNIFKGTYRLSKELVRHIVNEITPHVIIQRNEIVISILHKVLATAHFLGHESYQKSIANDLIVPMSQSASSRAINEICSAIIEHFAYIIKFPTTDDERNPIKADLLNRGRFPGIIGAIDCTQIAIQALPFNEVQMPGLIFLNRKGYYIIHTQIITDSNMKILGICARFPGSVHDSAIWRQSEVKTYLENLFLQGNRNSWLIGDFGYPLQPFSITPVGGNNLNPFETEFNRLHKFARNVIERLNGVLKARFKCCIGHKTLHYKPDVAGIIQIQLVLITAGILYIL